VVFVVRKMEYFIIYIIKKKLKKIFNFKSLWDLLNLRTTKTTNMILCFNIYTFVVKTMNHMSSKLEPQNVAFETTSKELEPQIFP